MNLTFLHVNYNNSTLTLNCIESIFSAHRDPSIEIKIIIIDNASISEEIELLKNWKQKQQLNSPVIFRFLNTNLGYFKAFNIGFELLSEEDKKSYIIIGNNDLKFDKDFINILRSKQFKSDVFVIAPNIINNQGLHQNPHLIKKLSRVRLLYYKLYYLHYTLAIMLNIIAMIFPYRSEKKNKLGFEQSRYITMGFGACYILTPRFFTVFQSLDDYLFLMGEEGMLANQILKVGGRTYYDNSLIVFHDDHASFKKIPSQRIYEYNRESFYLTKKHYKPSELIDLQIID